MSVPDSTATSVAFAAGLALGTLLGILCCRVRVRRELKELRERLRELEKAAQDTQDCWQRWPFYDESGEPGESGSVSMECAMLNQALCHMWPYLADIAKSLLFNTVEQKLQARLPKAMSGISFSRTQCHFGMAPLQIRKLIASSSQEGSWQNLTFTTELVLNGDCNIQLDLPSVVRGVVGSCTLIPTSVGVSHVKFRGTVVIELANLVPKVPLVSGVRVYFINPPILDLKMTGGFSGLLNVSLVKQHIIEAISQTLAQNWVLPKRMVHRFAKDLDIFRLKAPQPEGMLRLEIADLDGEVLSAGSGRLYIRVVFGDRDWQTVVKPRGAETQAVSDSAAKAFVPEGPTVLELTVHNRRVQQLCIQVYSEETTRLSGRVRGRLLAQSWVSCNSLIEDSDAWWPVGHCSRSLSMRQALETRFSVYKGREKRDGPASPTEVRLRSEWRQFQATSELFATCSGGEIPNGWQLCKEVDLGVTCTLLVGVRGATDLPSELAKYWCSVDCPNAAVLSMKKGERKHRTQRSKGKLVSDGGMHRGSRVEVLWDRAVLFHLQDPREAMVCLSVWQGSPKQPASLSSSCLGSVSYSVGRLLQREGLREVVREPLEDAAAGQQPWPWKDLCELAEEAARHRQPGSGKPFLEVVMQLWLLGSPQEAV